MNALVLVKVVQMDSVMIVLAKIVLAVIVTVNYYFRALHFIM